MKNLKDINVFITGGTRGIGLATAIKLSSCVNKVVICGRNEPKETLAQSNIIYKKLDISDKKQLNNVYEELVLENIEVDVLINNAGVAFFKPFNESEIDEVKQLFDVNLFGSIQVIQKFLPKMIEKQFGKIININSVSTFKVFKYNSIYAASKSAFATISKVLREEVREQGIDIIDIFPGATETELWDQSTKSQRAGRVMEAEDVALSVLKILEISINDRIIPEEVILRPKLGDL